MHRRASDNVFLVRKANLARLIEAHGGNSNFAAKLVVTPSYVSQLTHEKRTITEKTARRIERALRLPVGWMDIPQDETTRRTVEIILQSLLTGGLSKS